MRPELGARWRRRVLILLAGAASALSFAPGPLPAWLLPFVQIVTLSFLVAQTLSAANPRQAALSGWLFATAQFAVGVYWLTISMHQYGGLALPLAIAALLIFSAAMALYAAAACALCAWLCAHTRQPEQPAPRQILNALIWASSWTLFEWLRGTLFTGFTWLNIGYAHAEGMLAAWAPVVGVYGVAWLAAFAAAAIALMARAKDSPPYDRSAASVVVLALASGLIGIAGAHVEWAAPEGATLMVRLVQPATPQSEKFDPQQFNRTVTEALHLADLPAKDEAGHPDLIVLPETVMPIFQDQIPGRIWQQWQDVAKNQQATLILGVPLHTQTVDGNRYTNGAIALKPDESLAPGAPQPWHYDKHHLVPFGEFIPPGFHWFVHALQIPLGDFNRGPLIQPLLQVDGQAIALDICYEDTFGEEIAAQVAPRTDGSSGANLLVNISNLGWFGHSWALRQHLWMARMRALETARPLIAATNTGITAVISPDGQVRGALDPATPGVLDAEVRGTQGLTPYVRWRNTPILVWLALCLLAGLLKRRKAR
ncbi:MAG TPA: apolipoprotein N-acyltransferase [Castellaniella sp.]|uniref:apolipoprotein N-acyltransferase n=1 Tax=Castellaniella sp. TaxID=1955812 RepID=UPI002F140260